MFEEETFKYKSVKNFFHKLKEGILGCTFNDVYLINCILQVYSGTYLVIIYAIVITIIMIVFGTTLRNTVFMCKICLEGYFCISIFAIIDGIDVEI